MELIPYGPRKTCSTSSGSTIVLYIMITGIASLFCNADAHTGRYTMVPHPEYTDRGWLVVLSRRRISIVGVPLNITAHVSTRHSGCLHELRRGHYASGTTSAQKLW